MSMSSFTKLLNKECFWDNTTLNDEITNFSIYKFDCFLETIKFGVDRKEDDHTDIICEYAKIDSVLICENELFKNSDYLGSTKKIRMFKRKD